MKTLLFVLLFSLSSISFADGDFYKAGSEQNSPLFNAIIQGDFKKAGKLLKEGADPNKKGNVNEGSVIHALAYPDDEDASVNFLPILIHYDTNLDFQDIDGDTGLFSAIYMSKYKLLYSLLQSGASIRTKNQEGFNILYYIATLDNSEFKNPDLIKSLNFILSKVDQEFIDTAEDDSKSTSLHIAVYNQNIEFVRILAEKGNVNNIPNIHKETPIMMALLYLNHTLFNLAKTPQNINADKINEVKNLSEISYLLLNSLKPKELEIKYRDNESVNTILSTIKQGLSYIKSHQNQVPELSSLYNASKPIRDYLSRS